MYLHREVFMNPPWKFKSEDFKNVDWEDADLSSAAKVANAKLAEWFKDAKVLYGGPQTNPKDPLARSYSTWKREGDDFQCIAIDFKPIEKPKCEHPPNRAIYGMDGKTYDRFWFCCDCGAKLEPTGFKKVK